MLTAFAILTILVSIAALVGLAMLWLSASWEVLDDEQIPRKSAFRRWFGPPRLTYRRDRLGRFRRYRR